MSHAADHNLLLGIVALQMDFITRDQLVAGMNAWIIDKKKTLGQILVEQQAMLRMDLMLLEPLVARHIEQHSNDPQKSLAALSSADGLRRDLKALADADVQASVGVIGIDYEKTRTHAPPMDERDGTRFRILRPHARGGLGEVFVAKDVELNREVALKEIQPAKDHGESRARFVFEAEITGGLEHPGIVPVYGLGHYADGRPYYAMRFIRGDNVGDAIKRFHTEPGGLSARQYDSLEFRRLLQRFIDVCNAIAYAHSRGVLHRDLKPGNIMLGKYGETLVVDWGLAKTLSEPEALATSTDTEPRLIPASGSDSAPTEMGRMMGTPSYMSPEQATGRWDIVAAPADIYSLGATLYQLLTGVTPFTRVENLQRQIEQGEFPKPRELNPHIPRALEAICLKSMALKPGDRYADAQLLAADVEHWLADEPVDALREPFSLRAAGRWIRKHPGTVSAIAATIMVGMLGLGGGLYFVNAERNRTAERAEGERLAKIAAEDNLAYAKKGNELLGSVFAGLDPKKIAESGRPLQDVLKENLDKAVETLDGSAIGDPLTVAEMQHTLGLSLMGLGQYDKAIALFAKARATSYAKLGPDHPDTLTSMDHLAVGHQFAGRLADALPLFEETLKLRKAKLGPDHPQTLISMNNLANGYRYAGRLAEALPLFEETLKLTKAKLGPDHPDTLTSMNNLANGYQSAGRLAEALPLHEETLKLRKAKLGPDDPYTLSSMNNLAHSYQSAGRLAEALPLYEESLKLRKAKLGPDHPDTLTGMNNLAYGYRSAGRLADALPLFEETLKLTKAKLGPDHPQTLFSMNGLAFGYISAGRLAEALPLFEEASRGMEKRVYQYEGARAIVANTCLAFEVAKEFPKAESWRRKWLAHIKEKSGAESPAYSVELAGLGGNLIKQQKFADAEATLRESLAIRETKEPDAWQTFNTKSLLGEALVGQKKYADAEPLLLAGYEGVKARKDKIPEKDRPQRLSEAAERLLQLYDAWGKPDDAAKWRAELEDVKKAAAQADPKPAEKAEEKKP